MQRIEQVGARQSFGTNGAIRSYRQIHNEPSKGASSSSSTFRERLGELRRNGTPEIAIGSVILALVGVDYALQSRTDREREDVFRQLEREVRRDEAASRREGRRMVDGGAAAACKFKCVVRRVPQNFDGHKCLTNVREGDVVGVVEEGVGPGGQYNLCSIERRGGAREDSGGDSPEDGPAVSIGWFPISCLEKIE